MDKNEYTVVNHEDNTRYGKLSRGWKCEHFCEVQFENTSI